jgi:hypothetical protein
MYVTLTDEHKKLYAQRYVQNRPNSLMIVKAIIEQLAIEQKIEFDPMQVLSVNEGILSDPVVIAEIERIEEEPLKKGAIVRELHGVAQKMLKVGDHTEYNKTMRLISEIEGFISKGAKEDSGKTGIGQLKELVESIGMDKP